MVLSLFFLVVILSKIHCVVNESWLTFLSNFLLSSMSFPDIIPVCPGCFSKIEIFFFCSFAIKQYFLTVCEDVLKPTFLWCKARSALVAKWLCSIFLRVEEFAAWRAVSKSFLYCSWTFIHCFLHVRRFCCKVLKTAHGSLYVTSGNTKTMACLKAKIRPIVNPAATFLPHEVMSIPKPV